MADNRDDNNKREEILKAAKTCFKDNGFYGSSINDIAKTAGITKSLLYYYFTGKEDIFLALMEDSVERLLKTVKEAEKGNNSKENFDKIYNGIEKESDVLTIAMVDFLLEGAKTNVIMDLVKTCFDHLSDGGQISIEANFMRLMFISRAIAFYTIADKANAYFGVSFETAEKIHKEDLFTLYKKIYEGADKK